MLSEITHVAADVIRGPSGNFDHTIELSKGSGAGIREGMPVVAKVYAGHYATK